MSNRRLDAWHTIAVDTVFYRLLIFLTSLLPERLAFSAARRVGRSKYRRLRPLLARQSANMQQRLQVPPEHVEACLQRSYELEACEYLEGCLFRTRTREGILNLAEIRGFENLTEALERKRGAILYSGHVRGNFTFFATLGLLGLRPNPVRLQLRSIQHPIRRWFGDRFNRLMETKFGCRFLWTQPDTFGLAVQAANALRRNEIVNILIDLSFSAENIEVDFLGGRARFPVGPILLAQATGAPLLDYYVHRTDEWVPQVVEIGKPLYVSENPAEAIQYCARRLEEKIRQHPADWGPWLIENWNLFATWGEQAPWTFLHEAANLT